ncbi:hypothetical protein [Aureibacter tunicatorum]|uniref:Uncharacterized protein n=1 Tax=Aureibacter tunicatorum TaxID=866807 RepID=A0AAE4BP24_9BACT|nr:hypothetical protein [Aureibacter tunicatorum]MDR6237474.1 hypothetical protein [Aureibacter tunicatorum]BDD06463.1 hypothetical protein AUTU_39460 [Aureibacter tunicatorum]
MNISDSVEKIKKIDAYIKKVGSVSSEQLAGYMSDSVYDVEGYLNIMIYLGAPIDYDEQSKEYSYSSFKDLEETMSAILHC